MSEEIPKPALGDYQHDGRSLLVLSRYVGEEIIINDNITVKVMMIRDGKVRLAFLANKEIPIFRKEIWDKIQREREERR